MVAFALAGCADDKSRRLDRAFGSARRAIYIKTGGFKASGGEWRLVDGEFGCRLERGRADPDSFVSCVLPREMAQATWDRITKLGITNWRKSYLPSDVHPGMSIDDGLQWSVRFRIDGNEKKIWGDNTYPARDLAGTPILDMEFLPDERKVRYVETSFDDLMKIMGELRALAEKPKR